MTGQDLHVLESAFESCQGTMRSQGSSVSALGDRLGSIASALGDKNVGGDQCGQLADQVRALVGGLQQLGGSQGLGGAAQGLQAIVEKFHEVDRAQAANAKLVVMRGKP
ncbi:MAG: hypothetical protein JOY80_06580 [Candidatus Dormibacteraeota bacterium]|nr:hypothetical protein [Candidatus Dormibacteraeota bacterium]